MIPGKERQSNEKFDQAVGEVVCHMMRAMGEIHSACKSIDSITEDGMGDRLFNVAMKIFVGIHSNHQPDDSQRVTLKISSN